MNTETQIVTRAQIEAMTPVELDRLAALAMGWNEWTGGNQPPCPYFCLNPSRESYGLQGSRPHDWREWRPTTYANQAFELAERVTPKDKRFVVMQSNQGGYTASCDAINAAIDYTFRSRGDTPALALTRACVFAAFGESANPE